MGPATQVRLAAGSVCPRSFSVNEQEGTMRSQHTTHFTEGMRLLGLIAVLSVLMLIVIFAGGLPILG